MAAAKRRGYQTYLTYGATSRQSSIEPEKPSERVSLAPLDPKSALKGLMAVSPGPPKRKPPKRKPPKR
jgi:hypothetical protein